ITAADNAEHERFTGKLDDPRAEAMVPPMLAGRRDPGVHGCAVGKGREVSHDGRVGGEFGESRDVLIAPLPKQQPRGVQRVCHGYFFLSLAPGMSAKNICCSCSNPLRVAGSQLFSIASGSIALSVALRRSSTSGSS